jgi:tetraacyldisaccharide 4'-kinase
MARPRWQTALLNAWVGHGPLATLLWPISLIYQGLIVGRRQLYRWGFKRIDLVDALVLVVGNVVAGGAGKTPTVIAIAKHLTLQGRTVGVVSRGYGRTNQTCQEVLANARPNDVGDEPLLIHRATQIPVFVANTRIAAARALMNQYPQTEIIICDDGLQHYALYRDLEVCVFDNRGCGNNWLLPAGPLREAWPRKALRQAGQNNQQFLVLHTSDQAKFSGYHATRSLASNAVKADGRLVSLASLAEQNAPKLLALAGIAQPEAFFAMLRSMGLHLAQTLSLPDHYDFDSFSRNEYEGYQIICTEKDAQKLWQYCPDALAVPLQLDIDPAFFSALDARLGQRNRTPLSSTHGHPTT